MRKKVLEKNVALLTNRVSQLEEILCPCEQHDFVLVDTSTHYFNAGASVDSVQTHRYMCKRCKKIVYNNSH
jgi:hypothetical protein